MRYDWLVVCKDILTSNHSLLLLAIKKTIPQTFAVKFAPNLLMTYFTCDTPLVDWLLVRPKFDMGPGTELVIVLLQKTKKHATALIKI